MMMTDITLTHCAYGLYMYVAAMILKREYESEAVKCLVGFKTEAHSPLEPIICTSCQQ